jgi:hypothetical protein
MKAKLLPLNDLDKAAVAKALQRHFKESPDNRWISGLKMNYNFDGNFTEVVIQHGKELYVGTAKRMPRDKFDGRIGLDIAITRAIRSSPFTLD